MPVIGAATVRHGLSGKKNLRGKRIAAVLNHIIILATVWAIPVIVAVTFHEAAHGYVAHLLGDDTAWRLGRVTFNPLKHIDPVGTILMPGILILLQAPFLFGYAKPVPVRFRMLRHPRRDTVLVAGAGPAMNIALAVVAALSFHLVGYLPPTGAQWLASNLRNALILNVVLALFNLFPIPPLDGGRILTALLPRAVATPFAQIEPYGILILLGILIILPMLGDRLGVDLDAVGHVLQIGVAAVLEVILRVTGNS